jgi:hypothetical protein
MVISSDPGSAQDDTWSGAGSAAIDIGLVRGKGRLSALVKWEGVTTMGDKSPKAKERAKKQDTAGKDQRRAAIAAKASLSAVSFGKKTK